MSAVDGSKLGEWQSALGGKSPTEEPLSTADEGSEGVVRAEESTVDGLEAPESGEDTPKDSENSQAAAEASSKPEAQKAQTSGDREVITVTDETGRKRKVEIDYSNKDAIKKAYSAAAGMRKFQAERDQALGSKKALETEVSELKTNWHQLEGAYQKGKESLFDLLEGRPGAFKDYIKQQVDKAMFLRDASPEEVEAFNKKEEVDATRKELDKLRKDNEDFKKKVVEERETAELRSLESRVHPVFDKHRFADRLDSREDEQMFDEMLWNTALKRLEPYEKEGLDLSPEVIDREFRVVASSIRKRIGAQAEKRVNKVVEQKKQEATENVQARIKSNYTTDDDAKRLDKLLKSGDTGSIFKQWSSFRGILGSSKK